MGDEHSVSEFLAGGRSQCPSVKIVLTVSGSGRFATENGALSFYDVLERIPQDAVFPPVSLPCSAPAAIYFTSGTSGPPKMVLHNQISLPLGRFPFN